MYIFFLPSNSTILNLDPSKALAPRHTRCLESLDWRSTKLAHVQRELEGYVWGPPLLRIFLWGLRGPIPHDVLGSASR